MSKQSYREQKTRDPKSIQQPTLPGFKLKKLNLPKPKAQEIADHIGETLAQVKKARADYNYRYGRCNINCHCEPCISGHCAGCDVDLGRMSPEEMHNKRADMAQYRETHDRDGNKI